MIIDKYFSFLAQEKLFFSKNNANFYLNYLYSGMNFEKKRVLDIGGGSGLLSSLYAASMGASETICLEPETGGAQLDAAGKFEEARSALKLDDRVKLEKCTIQDFDALGQKFDVLISHNSINHFDEAACINLDHNDAAIEKYRVIFLKLYAMANDAAQLIIADCSRYNFFALCHLKNPLAPCIEWHKHQSPYLWASLLNDAGFTNPNIRWWSFNSLRSFGRLMLGNMFASYFLNSHFCLTMRKLDTCPKFIRSK